MSAPVKAGDCAQIGKSLVVAVSPYKVAKHWTCRVLRDPDPARQGSTRVVAAGTLSLFRVKAVN